VEEEEQAEAGEEEGEAAEEEAEAAAEAVEEEAVEEEAIGSTGFNLYSPTIRRAVRPVL
jgi:hypothetical protein